MFVRSLLSTVALGSLLAGSAVAQDRGVRLYAHGGGFNALTNLDGPGTSDFKKAGYTLGGGVGVQVHKYLTLRGDFTYARNEFRQGTTETGDKLNRFFYDAVVQLQIPTASGLEPYAFAGGGAVTLHEVGTSGQNKTKGVGTAGLGLAYTPASSPVGFFVEGKSWLYKPSGATGVLQGVDKTQYEIAWTAGATYRFGW